MGIGARIRHGYLALAVGVSALLVLAGGAIALSGGSLASSDASFTGAAPNDLAATSLDRAGDVNGDGFDDLLIGAPKNDFGPGVDGGSAYLVLGGPDGWGTETPLSRPAIVQYFGANNEEAGSSVAGAGDVNGDGFADLVVGAPLNDTVAADAGMAYLILGSATPTDGALTSHIQLSGEAASDRAGADVAGLGDVNGDNRSDLAIGAPVNAAAGAGAGAAYVVLGSAAPAGGSLASHIRFTGVAGDAAGTSVGGGGDFDGDGFADLIVGAPGNDTPGVDSGAAYIEPGSPALASGALDGIPPNVRLDGDSGDAAGTGVALGNVDGDGRADALVGAPLSDSGGADSGAGYFMPGRPGLPSQQLSVNGIRLAGEAAGDRAGTDVAAVGDVDGDSFGDFTVSAPFQGSVDKGAAYLVLGAASPGGALATHIRYDGHLNNDKAGTVGAAGDPNGDALADFLVGATENDIDLSNGGTAYLLFGGPPASSSPSYRTRVNLRGNSAMRDRPASSRLARWSTSAPGRLAEGRST